MGMKPYGAHSSGALQPGNDRAISSTTGKLRGESLRLGSYRSLLRTALDQLFHQRQAVAQLVPKGAMIGVTDADHRPGVSRFQQFKQDGELLAVYVQRFQRG